MAENGRLNQENKTKQKRNPKTKQQNPKQIQKTDDKQGKIYLQLILQRDKLPTI